MPKVGMDIGPSKTGRGRRPEIDPNVEKETLQTITQMDGASTWERLPQETAEAYRRFCIYRDMGPQRSVRQACIAYGQSASSAQNWQDIARSFNWFARVRAYDIYIEQLAREHVEDEVIKMQARHIKVAMAFQNKAIIALNEIDPKQLDPDQMLKWFKAAVDIERTAREQPAKIAQEKNDLRSKEKRAAVEKLLKDERFADLICDLSQEHSASEANPS